MTPEEETRWQTITIKAIGLLAHYSRYEHLKQFPHLRDPKYHYAGSANAYDLAAFELLEEAGKLAQFAPDAGALAVHRAIAAQGAGAEEGVK